MLVEDTPVTNPTEDFAAMFEASVQAKRFEKGQTLEGTIVGIGADVAFVDVGGKGEATIDIEELMVSGNPDVNLPLAPNDVINIPMEVPMTVYVFGEVTHPGPVQLKRSQNPTLLQAIAAAGGPTDRASKMATIKRISNGKSQNIRANYRKLAEGTDPDVPLQDGDTIYVRESIL